MASNQLPDGTKETISTIVDQLFGRVFEAYPCPLNMDQMRDLSWALHSDEHLERIKYLYADYGKTFFVTRFNVHLIVDGCAAQFQEILPKDDGSNQFFAVPDEFMRTNIERPQLIHRLGLSLTNELVLWLKNAKELARQFNESWGCLDELLRMASTPGQLRRMLPDLVEYLGTKERRMLMEQKRASSMPFDWAAFDRDKVTRLSDNMARCKLLPESAKTWGNHSSYTWTT